MKEGIVSLRTEVYERKEYNYQLDYDNGRNWESHDEIIYLGKPLSKICIQKDLLLQNGLSKICILKDLLLQNGLEEVNGSK